MGKSPLRRRHRSQIASRFTRLLGESLETRLLMTLTPQLLADINIGSGSSSPESLTVVNNVAYFAANDGTHGPELWRSDGTPAGTKILKDIVPGEVGSDPSQLVNVNG